MHTEIVKQINDLPIAERVEIIEEVTRGVRRDLRDYGETNGNVEKRREERRAAIERLRGIARVEGKTPPTDQEAKDDYYNYLAEKYK